MATNQSLWDYYKTQDENNQKSNRVNPFAVIQAQLMGQNAMQGNNRFLTGMLLGEWLKRYIAKMSDTKDPSPEGEVNADTISQMTQGYMNDQYGTPADQLSRATGYTPPQTAQNYDFLENRTPYFNAMDNYSRDSLKQQLDANRQMPQIDSSTFQSPANQSTIGDFDQLSRYLPKTYEEVTNARHKEPFDWNNILKNDINGAFPQPMTQYDLTPNQDTMKREKQYPKIKNPYEKLIEKLSNIRDSWQL